ncbi:MAG: hypothetical protein QG626_252 [Patescibacteria group bacterium]|jgi:hypothetical protein|nr:hypothetical protein [Patescibacteria group bacterium]MDQ5952125.1 hypothetical protein [Patescibacteria group bacterium]
MKTQISLIGLIILCIGIIFYTGSIVYQFSYKFTPLYSDCSDGNLLGLTKSEAEAKMEAYTRDPYLFDDDTVSGEYGNYGRLKYDEVISYSHDKRQAECRIFFLDGLVIQTQGIFE